MKIVIWGHPLYSHTHSYVHSSYYKAAKSMGHEVYWFHDQDYPKDFDYSNTTFITEGFADANIPLNSSSTYFVMYCPSPKKYLDAGVKRYIDVRCVAKDHHDHIHSYSVDKTTTQKVGPSCYFVPKTNNKVHVKNNYIDYTIDDFDKFYLSWATNLLPSEFNMEDVYLKRENAIYFCGSLSGSGICENLSNWLPFINECKKHGIAFYHNDPWKNPLSDDKVKELVQKSILGIDIRGPEHVKTSIITCRIFKNISYGHLGLTNSEEIYKEMDGNCIYNPNPQELFRLGMEKRTDYETIKKSMLYVKENHTYINRITSMFSIL
jgi:hypothetical protein